MRKKLLAGALCVLLAIGTSTRGAWTQVQVPLQIQQLMQSLNIPPSQIPTLYTALLVGMAGSSELGNFFNGIRVASGYGLGQSIGHAARVQILETLVGGFSAMEAAVVQRLSELAQIAAGTPNTSATFARLVGDSASWGGKFLDIYRDLGGVRPLPPSTRGGFVSLQMLLVVTTALVAGTMGYVAGKTILKQQDLQVQAAETQAYLTLLNNLVASMQAGRTKLLPGLTQQTAIQRVIRNLEAGLPPYSDVLEVRPPPDLAGGWQGDLVVKEVQGQSNIQVGQSRRVAPNQFRIEQDGTEVTLVFGGNKIKGYFGPADFMETGAGQQRTQTVVENVTLLEPIEGNLSRAQLKYHHGAGAGGLAGQLVVEIEQRSTGATITSGGMLKRGRN
jgi:hypothetical protein